MLIYLSKLHRDAGSLGSCIGRTASLSLESPTISSVIPSIGQAQGMDMHFGNNVYIGAEIGLDISAPNGLNIPMWKSVEMYRLLANSPPLFVERYFVEDSSESLRPQLIPFAAKHRSSNDIYTVLFYRNISQILQKFTGDRDFHVTDPRFAALNILENKVGSSETHILQMGDIARRNPLVGNVGFSNFGSSVIADQIINLSSVGASPLLNSFTVGDISWKPIREAFPQLTDMAPTVAGTHDRCHDLLFYMQKLENSVIDTSVPAPLDISQVEDADKSTPKWSYLLEDLSKCLGTDFDFTVKVGTYGMVDRRSVTWLMYVDRYATLGAIETHKEKDAHYALAVAETFVKQLEAHSYQRSVNEISNCLQDGRGRIRIVRTFGEEVTISLEEEYRNSSHSPVQYSPLFTIHCDIAAMTLCSDGISPVPFDNLSAFQNHAISGSVSLGRPC